MTNYKLLKEQFIDSLLIHMQAYLRECGYELTKLREG